mgnify:CR=1 FL=1
MCLIGPLEIGKRYAAGVFHKMGQEASGLAGSRSVYWGFSPGDGSQMSFGFRGCRGADAPSAHAGVFGKGKRCMSF